MNQNTIPGNRYSEARIYSDTSLVWLEAELKKVTGAQAANQRSNNRYVLYVKLLRRSINSRRYTDA